MSNYRIELEKEGYFRVANPPSNDELKKYYQDKYWQEVTGFDAELNSIERSYIKNTVALKSFVVKKYLGADKLSIIDIGTGEGHTLNYFKENGHEVLGLDFSNFGIKKHYPDLLPKVLTGDIYESINELILAGKQFNLVILDNVLEHVLSPVELLDKLKKIMYAGNNRSALLVRVPNDFSAIQSFLIEEKLIDKKYWIAPPDHLNYFNTDSLQKFFELHGFSMDVMYADWDIELDLLNPNSNYVNNKSVGKASHNARMMTENIIANNDLNKVLNFYEASAKIGLGRTITALFKIL
jgi:SAM-dependent methyltransferase